MSICLCVLCGAHQVEMRLGDVIGEMMGVLDIVCLIHIGFYNLCVCGVLSGFRDIGKSTSFNSIDWP